MSQSYTSYTNIELLGSPLASDLSQIIALKLNTQFAKQVAKSQHSSINKGFPQSDS